MRRAILRAAAENMQARPAREVDLRRKLVASYWRPGDPEARAPREALARVVEPDEALTLRRSIYADYPDSTAAADLINALPCQPGDCEEAEWLAREWLARSEPGRDRGLWGARLADLLATEAKDEEAAALRVQYPPIGGSCGGGFTVGLVPPDENEASWRRALAGSERLAFNALSWFLHGDAAITEDLAGELINAFSRAYLSEHPLWAIQTAYEMAGRFVAGGLPGAATEIASRTEALLIEHQGEDSPLLKLARQRFAAAAPSLTP